MGESLILPAPAKLNLMLQITGQRDDGYHLLQTVFQFIDIADIIEFHTNYSGELLLKPGNSPVAPEDDLLLAAASLLQTRYQVNLGVEISIDKKLPIGGGLGGGSSDAASLFTGPEPVMGLRFDRWIR